jgi:hypothetical protein
MPSALLLGLAATSSGMVKGSFFSGSCQPPVFVRSQLYRIRITLMRIRIRIITLMRIRMRS